MKVYEDNLRSDRPLVNPVVIVLETVEELNWAYDAFANMIHHKETPDDSAKQEFFCGVYTSLNIPASKYRGK